jgi:hypothetical protein
MLHITTYESTVYGLRWCINPSTYGITEEKQTFHKENSSVKDQKGWYKYKYVAESVVKAKEGCWHKWLPSIHF